MHLLEPLLLVLLTACSDKASVDSGPTGSDGGTSELGAWREVVLYFDFGCAVDGAGIAVCSGLRDINSPTGLEPETELHGLAVAAHTACGLDVGGQPSCFGLPSEVTDLGLLDPPAISASLIAGGILDFCAIDADTHLATCWGANSYGISEAEPGESLSSLSVSRWGACGITERDRSIQCWGESGEDVITGPPDGTWSTLDLGGFVGVAIDEDGSLAFWGTDYHGVEAVPDGTYAQVSVGEWYPREHRAAVDAGLAEDGELVYSQHACAIDTDGELTCWGDPTYGATEPPALGPGWTDVSADGLYSCGIHSGELYCWGIPYTRGELPPVD